MNMNLSQKVDWPAPLDAPKELFNSEFVGRVPFVEQAKKRHDPELVTLFAKHACLGDELGYAAWKDLYINRLGSKEMVALALEEGIDAVADAPESLKAFFDHVDTVPEWVDWDQINRGSAALWRCGDLVLVCKAYAAVAVGYRSYGGTRPLAFSRLLVDKDKTPTRYDETFRWLLAATSPDAMRRSNEGFKYSIRVRMVHGAVRYGLSHAPTWDWQDWGLPTNNLDNIFTSGAAFYLNTVDALQRMGLRFTDQELEDMGAMWRYIGHVMGAPEELNITSYADAVEKRAIIEAIEAPSDEVCRMLFQAVCDYAAENVDGYQPLPSWIVNTLSVEQKHKLGSGLIRAMIDSDICEEMHVSESLYKYPILLLAKAIGIKERIFRGLQRDDMAAAEANLSKIKSALAVDDERKAIVAPSTFLMAVKKNPGGLQATLADWKKKEVRSIEVKPPWF